MSDVAGLGVDEIEAGLGLHLAAGELIIEG